jgi:hypothetical protein
MDTVCKFSKIDFAYLYTITRKTPTAVNNMDRYVEPDHEEELYCKWKHRKI